MNNTIFSICGNENQNEKYQCCVQTCTTHSQQPEACLPFCAQVFPMMKDYCVFKMNCWNNGFYDPKCIQRQRKEIQQCCLDECSQYRVNRYSSDELDCQSYCADYVIHS